MTSKELILYTWGQINLRLLLVLILSGALIGYLRRTACNHFMKKPFGSFILNFFNLVGIPIHELGHLLMGLLFGFKITKVCLYRTQKKAGMNNGTLGYVHMTHSTNHLFSSLQQKIGNFFVGIGPLIFGPLVILITAHFLPSKVMKFAVIISGFVKSKTFSFSVLKEWFLSLNQWDYLIFFAFLYLIIGIGLNLELSRADISAAAQGLMFMELLLLLVSFLCATLHLPLMDYVVMLSGKLISISAIGLASSFFVLLLSLI